jgi:hypothetical protein
VTLRGGSYDKSKPDWHGIIRDDGWPVYECYHWGKNAHDGPKSARECARKALAYLKEHNQLPEGWTLTEKQRRVNEQAGKDFPGAEEET